MTTVQPIAGPDLGAIIIDHLNHQHLNHQPTQAANAVPARLLPGSTPAQLVTAAHRALGDARQASSPVLRYGAAHLAALRAAAAVVAYRAQPAPGRGPENRSVWALLAVLAPEFAEWATHFDGAATTRARVEAGIGGPVTAEDAYQAIQAAELFVAAAGQAIR